MHLFSHSFYVSAQLDILPSAFHRAEFKVQTALHSHLEAKMGKNLLLFSHRLYTEPPRVCRTEDQSFLLAVRGRLPSSPRNHLWLLEATPHSWRLPTVSALWTLSTWWCISSAHRQKLQSKFASKVASQRMLYNHERGIPCVTSHPSSLSYFAAQKQVTGPMHTRGGDHTRT